MSLKWPMLALACLFALTGCSSEAASEGAPGQITRPGNIDLPLDNPESVAAFDVADDLLLNWFLLEKYERALEYVHPNLRESWRSLIEDTEVKRKCSLLQVKGTRPDASGMVQARYALGNCQVVAPGGLTAVYIQLTIVPGEGGPWVTQIELLR